MVWSSGTKRGDRIALLEAEMHSRHDSPVLRLLREARFPDIKTLDQGDWTTF